MPLTTTLDSIGNRLSLVGITEDGASDTSFGMIAIVEDPKLEGSVSLGSPIAAAEISLAEGSTFRINPYTTRDWTKRDEVKFDDLAFKKAIFQITIAENAELQEMIAARRRNIDGRTAGEIMRTAEHDLLLKEMKEVLQRYHAFTRKARPHN
jgi:hypothetical protein